MKVIIQETSARDIRMRKFMRILKKIGLHSGTWINDFCGQAIQKGESTRDEQTEPETIGIMVESLTALNPGPEIELIAERLFRMRVLAIEQRK
jgi:predicted xylose isomerase-like sugar epimerase